MIIMATMKLNRPLCLIISYIAAHGGHDQVAHPHYSWQLPKALDKDLQVKLLSCASTWQRYLASYRYTFNFAIIMQIHLFWAMNRQIKNNIHNCMLQQLMFEN
ncbi:hypothetical protein ACJX0J_018819 [Zea mays]